ncbi:MAG: hypothetical protein WBW52_16005 [Desulfobaccales bacterium]
MMMVNAKSGFWSLVCPCGAEFQLKGITILTMTTPLACPNCGESLPLANLILAVNSLANLQDALAKIESEKYPGHGASTWKITPPL